MKIYAVRDAKAEEYLQPFYAKNQATACRAIGAAVNEPGHTFCENAEDYTLFEIGEFDEITGTIKGSTDGTAIRLVHLRSLEGQAEIAALPNIEGA